MINARQIGVVALTWLLWSCFALTTVAGLSGCASNAPSATTTSDLVTDSDEPETRKRARRRLELAVLYFEKGQTTVALDELKQSIVIDPNFFDAYNMRGLIYMRLNDMPLAEESFRKALSINPKAAAVQHNYGWLMCQQGRLPEATKLFGSALANPAYGDRAKTWMTQGLCQMNNGQREQAEVSLLKAYELDAGNPIVAYNLAVLFFQRGESARSQFYVRRINNSDLANAESLWLGIKVERKLDNRDGVAQLGAQLVKRFSQSIQASAFERGAFDE